MGLEARPYTWTYARVAENQRRIGGRKSIAATAMRRRHDRRVIHSVDHMPRRISMTRTKAEITVVITNHTLAHCQRLHSAKHMATQ